MYDYSGVAKTAQRLIAKFGKSITKRTVAMSGDAWNPTPTNTDTTIKAVSINFKSSEIDGTLILATDKQYLTYTALTTADKIIDEVELSVINVAIVNPSDTKIIYKVQARRS